MNKYPLKSSLIPESLRNSPRWYVTASEPYGARGDISSVPYSPVTLSGLRWSEPADFSSYGYAVETIQDHPVWFDNIGLHVVRPYVAVVIVFPFDTANKLKGGLRTALTKIGGYWERQSEERILGIVRSEAPVLEGFGLFQRLVTYVVSRWCKCKLTGNPIPGLDGDPDKTNQDKLWNLIWEVKLHPDLIPLLWRQYSAECKAREAARKQEEERRRAEQLSLFKAVDPSGGTS